MRPSHGFFALRIQHTTCISKLTRWYCPNTRRRTPPDPTALQQEIGAGRDRRGKHCARWISRPPCARGIAPWRSFARGRERKGGSCKRRTHIDHLGHVAAKVAGKAHVYRHAHAPRQRVDDFGEGGGVRRVRVVNVEQLLNQATRPGGVVNAAFVLPVPAFFAAAFGVQRDKSGV